METQRAIKEEKEEIEEVIKITISKEAGESLNEILFKVNEGFDAGKVSRQDVSSWIIDRFKKSFTDNDIQSIRKDFFSERFLLESILKQAKVSGDVPEFIKDALKKHWTGALGSSTSVTPAHRRPARIPVNSKSSHLTNQTNN